MKKIAKIKNVIQVKEAAKAKKKKTKKREGRTHWSGWDIGWSTLRVSLRWGQRPRKLVEGLEGHDLDFQTLCWR